MTDGDPTISLVLPLSCGPEQALECLSAIAAQSNEPAFEVIVVDDASTGLDGLLSQLDGDVTVLRSDRRLGLAGALRLGLTRARGTVAAILRDAAVPAPGWLAGLASALDHETCAIALSANAGDPATPALAARAAAARTADLRGTGIPDVPDELLLGSLALGLVAGGGRAEVVAASVVAPARRAGQIAGLAPRHSPELTIVIPTLEASSPRLRRCLEVIAGATEVAHEIVIVDNGCPAQGFSAPVNAGIRAARTPYVVVMNDDVEVQPGWWPPLRQALDGGAPVAFPLTIDGAMREDFAAWCFAVSREAIETFGHAPGEFFDPELVVWFQDTDLLISLRRAGRPPVLVRDSRIRHGLSVTVGTTDPALSAWIRVQIQADEACFRAKNPDVQLARGALAGA